MHGNRAPTTLGKLIDKGDAIILTGPFGTQLHAHDYEPIGLPVIPANAIRRRLLNTEELPRVSAATANRLARYEVRRGDILFARRGAQATGLSALVGGDQDGWIAGTGIIVLRVLTEHLDPVFLSFLLSSDAAITWLKTHAVGAVMPNLNEGVLRRLPLQLPPLPEQQAIARILGTIDEKIELNRRMNATLEAMARALFQSWFVDFDPVRAKAEGRQPAGMDAETAGLFPNEFDGAANGEVPRGWRVGTLREIARQERRAARPHATPSETPYIGLEHMPRKSIALGEWGTSEDVVSQKLWFRRGEILFGKLRPYFHKVGITVVDGVCSTDIVVLAPVTAEWFGIALEVVSSDDFVAFVTASADGTKMPRTRWKDMARFEVPIPPLAVAARFTQIVSGITALIDCNIRQSRSLAAARDMLLPRLLSGELRVRQVERELEAVL